MDKQKEKMLDLLDESSFGRYFLLVLFALSLFAFLSVMRVFLVDIVISAVFATICYPAYLQVKKALWNNKNAAAFLCTALVFLVIVIPAAFILKIVAAQFVGIYSDAGPKIVELIKKADALLVGGLQDSATLSKLGLEDADFQSWINEGLKFLGITTAQIINKTSLATVSLVVNLFMMLVSIFFFLRDGDRMLKRLRDIIPLSEAHRDKLFGKFVSMSRAVIRGTLLVGLIQSVLGAVTLVAFGVESWMFWSVIMLVLSVIPFVGTGAVLIPTGIIMIIYGEVWKGAAMIFISLVVISSIDNLLRPRFIGRDEGMHYLLVFFSILGGIALLGAPGIILGPLITALFMAIVEIYSVEFKEHIEFSRKGSHL
jgi:predicted PurR-regulated permease PerM